jgi:hypothetical protein
MAGPSNRPNIDARQQPPVRFLRKVEAKYSQFSGVATGSHGRNEGRMVP